MYLCLNTKHFRNISLPIFKGIRLSFRSFICIICSLTIFSLILIFSPTNTIFVTFLGYFLILREKSGLNHFFEDDS